jgi:hypothetical protein
MSVAIVAKRDCDVKDIISRSPVAGIPHSEQILKRWLRTSDEVYLGMHDDKVACVWGLAPPTAISNRAYLWLLTTDLVEQHKFTFVRHSQLVVQGALKKYDIIIGNVMANNGPARRWLRWLGADIGPINFETGYCPFTIRRK